VERDPIKKGDIIFAHVMQLDDTFIGDVNSWQYIGEFIGYVRCPVTHKDRQLIAVHHLRNSDWVSKDNGWMDMGGVFGQHGDLRMIEWTTARKVVKQPEAEADLPEGLMWG
jgi:hypothetical protein